MAYDPKQHFIDERTGFVRDKATGARLGIDQIPVEGSLGDEFPKWVVPHESHVKRLPHGAIVEKWPNFHVERDGSVKVLAADADDEKELIAEAIAEDPANEPGPAGENKPDVVTP